jgi:hypothetical protein
MYKANIIQMYKDKKSYREIAQYTLTQFPELNYDQAWNKGRDIVRKSDEYKAKQGTEKKEEEKKTKTVVYENQKPIIINEKWKGDKVIRFGIVTDTHFNSKYAQITHLHNFYDICEQNGIHKVYHAGDIDEGENMRPGHKYECYKQGADDHVDEIVRIYPQRKGITTEYLTGNHDASMIKHCGYNIGPAIAHKREDMKYLGSDCAIINLTENCKLELRHPWNGSSYADSYQIQKIVEAMESDSKPNLLVVGHYHKAGQFFPRNVHALLGGAFQSQTPFTRGKNLRVQMGGWIIEMEVDKQGTIEVIKPIFIPYYKAIEDDYKNWR